MTKKLVMDGTISCIYHDYTGRLGPGAGIIVREKEKRFYSALYVKIGRKELAIIRPDGKQFNWRGKGEIRSGDQIKITLEIVKKKR